MPEDLHCIFVALLQVTTSRLASIALNALQDLCGVSRVSIMIIGMAQEGPENGFNQRPKYLETYCGVPPGIKSCRDCYSRRRTGLRYPGA